MRELVSDSLWVAEMPAAKMGFEFGARMTLVRLPDGGLWIHSPIQLTSELKASVDAAGPVRCIVAPSKMHYEHAEEFAHAYPDAGVWIPPEFEKKLEIAQTCRELNDLPPPEWAGTLDQVILRGSAMYDEVDFFHPASRTLILTDLLFHIPEEEGGTTALWAKLLGIHGHLDASRSFKLSLRDREAMRRCLLRIEQWDFDRVIITHGKVQETGGKAEFLRAFDWLMKKD